MRSILFLVFQLRSSDNVRSYLINENVNLFQN